MKEVYCDVCNTLFVTNNPRQKRCSQECMRAAFKLMSKRYQEKKKREKEIEKAKAKESKFAPINDFIKQHYAETGELLTYGKAVVIMERRSACGD